MKELFCLPANAHANAHSETRCAQVSYMVGEQVVDRLGVKQVTTTYLNIILCKKVCNGGREGG